jgi:hypothetical protein
MTLETEDSIYKDGVNGAYQQASLQQAFLQTFLQYL